MNDIPPVLDQVDRPRPKWRWAVHLSILLAYVLAIGLMSLGTSDASKASEPAMPKDLRGLFIMAVENMVFFLFLFGLACAFSRPKPGELLLRWRGGLKPILLGFVYSVALRLAIIIMTVIIVAPVVAIRGEEKVNELRPKVEHLVNMEALKDPAYFLFTTTAISFGLAGFREELWRAGVLAGFVALSPVFFGTRKGMFIAILLAAAVFGLGHLPQGVSAVFLTAALGLGLGLIMVRHQSIWEAVIAHGFFDATTFAMLFVVVKFTPNLLKQFGVSG